MAHAERDRSQSAKSNCTQSRPSESARKPFLGLLRSFISLDGHMINLKGNGELLMRKQIPALVALLTMTGGLSLPSALANEADTEKNDLRITVALDNTVETAKINKKINSLYTYKNEKNFERFNAISRELTTAFEGLESHIKTPQQAEIAITWLKQLAYTHCSSRPRWAPPESVKPADYEIANSLKLRALALEDKYHPDINARVNAHREMMWWYTSMKKDREAADQSKILSKLLNTTDPNKINPPPPQCLACGMG